MTRLLAWIAFLALALATLLALPIPPGDDGQAAFAGVRVVALGLGGYLLAVSVLGLALRLLRIGAAVRVADLVTVPFVRRLLNRAAMVTLTASLASPAAAFAVEHPVEPPPVMRVIEEAPEAPVAPPAPASGPAAPALHTVSPGENCWSIAASLLETRLGRTPTDAEVAPTWRALVDANANRFRTGNPDLIFSGQELVLPAQQ
ncbi:MAG: resuscitation-promoting factor RpfA [Actinomycetota bacterium]|jgi:hypothetical protein